MPTIQTFTEHLKCKLTEEELKEKAKILARVCEEIVQLEAEKAASSKSFNGKLGDLETRRADLARMVRSEQEFRPVACADELIRDDKAVVTVRCDTGEELRRREARPDELVKGPTLFDKPEDRPLGFDTDPQEPPPPPNA